MAGGMDLGGGGGKGKKPLDTTINLVPFIDLMAVTIVFLIMTAVWTQLGRLQVSQSGQNASEEQQQDQNQDSPNQDNQNQDQGSQGEQNDQPPDQQQPQPGQGQPQDGNPSDQQPNGMVPQPGERLTAEQARQLLAAIAQGSQTLQERLQQLFVSPRPPSGQDW